MENEKKKEIENCKDLLYQKYQYMYKNHNKYHPSNLKFQPHPPSLKLSQCTPEYYELFKDNKYLGEKIKEVQKGHGYYNCEKNLSEYKKLKYIRDARIKSSKYNQNVLLNLVTPLTYEKRLKKILDRKKNVNQNNNFKKAKSRDIFFSNRYSTQYSNNFGKKGIKIFRETKEENTKPIGKIKIERENMETD